MGALKHIKQTYKFYPKTIIDIGAAFGDWSRNCLNIFPKAKYLLIEPLSEFSKVLGKFAHNHKNINYLQFAVGPKNKKISINIHQDLVGSSLLKEKSQFSDGHPRKVCMISLDHVCKNLKGPYLIKADV